MFSIVRVFTIISSHASYMYMYFICHSDYHISLLSCTFICELGPMEDQNFCSKWVTLLYPNVLYNVLYECLFIINTVIITVPLLRTYLT